MLDWYLHGLEAAGAQGRPGAAVLDVADGQKTVTAGASSCEAHEVSFRRGRVVLDGKPT
jgi:hypothetical protein